MGTVPARRQERPTRPLPAPELVNLIGDSDGEHTASPATWWEQYGGALDVASGVVRLPGPKHPPSPFHSEDCPNCVPPTSGP